MIRTARMADAEAILQLVNRYGTKGLMLTKSPYDIYKNIQSFFVYEEDGAIAGCSRLSVVWKDMAEVASLAVDERQMKKGIGRKLVEACIKRAADVGIPKVFCLTYQCDFFSRCGFTEIKRTDLPYKVFGDCLNCPKVECCDEHAFIYNVSGS